MKQNINPNDDLNSKLTSGKMNKLAHILAVDDNDLVRNLIERIVNNYIYNEDNFNIKFRTFGCASVDSTIARLNEEKPNHYKLIISDIYMPEKTGIDLCKYLSDSKLYQNIPIVLVTGLAPPNMKMPKNACGLLRKPWGHFAIENILKKYVVNPMIDDSKTEKIGYHL
jgi:CheY-like chemotaxis protein